MVRLYFVKTGVVGTVYIFSINAKDLRRCEGCAKEIYTPGHDALEAQKINPWCLKSSCSEMENLSASVSFFLRELSFSSIWTV